MEIAKILSEAKDDNVPPDRLVWRFESRPVGSRLKLPDQAARFHLWPRTIFLVLDETAGRVEYRLTRERGFTRALLSVAISTASLSHKNNIEYIYLHKSIV